MIILIGLSGAVKFASFELSKSWLFPKVDEKYHNTLQFVCAAGAFVACSVILVPGEVLKTRLQAGSVNNLFQGITSIIKEDGIGGLFAGYAATLFRDVPYTMLELGLYENIKTFMRKRNAKKMVANGEAVNGDVDLSTQQELTAAAITGAFTGWATTPLGKHLLYFLNISHVTAPDSHGREQYYNLCAVTLRRPDNSSPFPSPSFVMSLYIDFHLPS